MKKIIPDLISVIVNCRNGEQYLQNALESINAQDYKKFEVIFFDNQSEDDSAKIAKQSWSFDLKYIESEKYYSLYDARNQAIKYANGEYLCFLDVDDFWDQRFLSSQIKFIKRKKSDFICSNYIILTQKTNGTSSTRRAWIIPKRHVSTDKLINSYFCGLLTLLIKRQYFERIGGFDPKYNMIGDFEFVIRNSRQGKFSVNNEKLATYRNHQNNLQSKAEKKQVREIKMMMKASVFEENIRDELKRKYGFFLSRYLYNNDRLVLAFVAAKRYKVYFKFLRFAVRSLLHE